jgi:hypothetical protein
MKKPARDRPSFRVEPMDDSCRSTGMNSLNQDDEIRSLERLIKAAPSPLFSTTRTLSSPIAFACGQRRAQAHHRPDNHCRGQSPGFVGMLSCDSLHRSQISNLRIFERCRLVPFNFELQKMGRTRDAWVVAANRLLALPCEFVRR